MATSNKAMGDLLRTRRAQMAEIPEDDAAYTGPPKDAVEESPEPKKEFTVKAPGEPSTGEQFEYEPFVDIPGAWVVYPPGVPCDDNEYRVVMDTPAEAGDFEGMQRVIDNRESVSPDPPITQKKVEPGQDFPQFAG